MFSKWKQSVECLRLIAAKRQSTLDSSLPNKRENSDSCFGTSLQQDAESFLINPLAFHMFHDGDKRKYTFNISGKLVYQYSWYMGIRISRRWNIST